MKKFWKCCHTFQSWLDAQQDAEDDNCAESTNRSIFQLCCYDSQCNYEACFPPVVLCNTGLHQVGFYWCFVMKPLLVQMTNAAQQVLW